jgi:large subunit ribosomal protein L19e
MSNLRTQKRIAAQVLGIGESRVWVNPDAATDVAQAMTREDVRGLIEQGLIQEKPKTVPSRQRAKERVKLRRRRKGVSHGKRKGTAGGRKSSKDKWMEKVRAQRRFLQDIKSKKIIAPGVYRKYYLRAKGGSYETLRQMKEAMRTDGTLKIIEKKK